MHDLLEERGYWEILAEARAKYPSSSFLKKCEAFYKENKSLTREQIKALDNLPDVKSKDAEFFISEDATLDDVLDLMVKFKIIKELERGEIWAIDMASEYLEEDFEVCRAKR